MNQLTKLKRKTYLFFGCSIVLVASLLGGSVFLTWKAINHIIESEQSKVVKLVETASKEDKVDLGQENFTSSRVLSNEGVVVNLVRKASPAVVTVSVRTEYIDQFTGKSQNFVSGTGTGFFISEQGLLITNEHVLCNANGDAKLVEIITSENKRYKVDSFVVDTVQDIAIANVQTKGEKVPYLKFANPNSKTEIGQEVVAIGNPLGVNPGSVTRGIVSGLNRNVKASGECNLDITQTEYEGLIQTDAALTQGNSGGPLLNLNGEVIGVNSAVSEVGNDISYSIPSDRVLSLLENYSKNDKKLKFPYLGVAYEMLDPVKAEDLKVPEGALVKEIAKGSPAEKAGLKKGDIIESIGEKRVDFSLRTTLNLNFKPGDKVKIKIFRYTQPTENKEVILEATLDENK